MEEAMTGENKMRELENLIKTAECMCLDLKVLISKLHVAFDELPRKKELVN